MAAISQPVPGPQQPKLGGVRFYYCTTCGLMWFNFPPDRICLGCHKQGGFKQVDINSVSVTETFPA